MDARLQRAIQTPRIQTQAWELVSLAQRALDDLRQLDDGLYERFVATRDAPMDRKTAAASLEQLWDTTFSGLSQLLWACRSMVKLQSAGLEGDDTAGAGGENRDHTGPVVTDDELRLPARRRAQTEGGRPRARQRGLPRFSRAD